LSDAGLVELPPGSLVQDRYLIMRPVGQGGLSTVYQVRDTHGPGSPVYALKEQWDRSQGARKQFAREAGWLKALDHPNIPKVTAFFEWRGRLYLVMEFIDGENLEQKLERAGGRPLPESQVLSWVLPICDALTYLHTRVPPILHRDVKPANIIVTPTGRPVLVDLGIAKEHGPVANKTATFVRKAGTEGYAPPEQYAAAGLSGPWSDVYGYAATVYHLLTTQIPPTAVERVALDARLAPPGAYNPTVCKTTDAAIMRALAIRPQDRFPTVAHLKHALQSGATSGPLSPYAAGQTPSGPSLWSGSLPTLERAQVVPSALPSTGQSVSAPRARAVPSTHPTGASSGPLSSPTSATAGRAAAAKRVAPVTLRIDDPARSETESHLADGRRPLLWWSMLAAVALIAAAAAVIMLHLYAPIDRSTPSATVNGYFAALESQDYTRAWEYTASSTNSPNLQPTFIRDAQADDALNGRVLSIVVSTSTGDGSSHETVAILVTRAGTPHEPASETVHLTQYAGNWLIDSIVPG
jgi:serine/threonine protein kinase, bacterial